MCEIEPKCFSSGVFISKVGSYYSKDLFDDIKYALSATDNNVDHIGHNKAIGINYNSFSKKIITINYEEFWLDGDTMGVMLHPITKTPIWLNEPAIEMCRYINGKRTLGEIMKKVFVSRKQDYNNQSLLKQYLGVVLLLRDLDMITFSQH